MYESLTCKGCGGWLPDTTDPNFAAMVEHGKCYGCQSIAINQRDEAKKHEKETPRPGKPFWTDGTRVGVRAATPSEKAAGIRPE